MTFTNRFKANNEYSRLCPEQDTIEKQGISMWFCSAQIKVKNKPALIKGHLR